ncbi:MAG: RNA repair domain-containing protein [Thermosphaera sp.]
MYSRMLSVRKKGEIEEWLKKIFFGGRRSEYIVFIKFREGDESVLKPIPGELITDVRKGYIFVGEDQIPFHRVVEIRLKNGVLVYKRGEKA